MRSPSQRVRRSRPARTCIPAVKRKSDAPKSSPSRPKATVFSGWVMTTWESEDKPKLAMF